MYSLAVVLLFVSRSKHKAEDPPQKKKPVKESMIQLKPVRVIEDGREGEPEDRAFTVEMDDKHNTEEKEPLKSKVLGSGEGTPAAEVGEPAETTAAVQSKMYEPSLWWAICRTFCKPFTVGAFFKLGHDLLLFVSPMLLKYVSAVTLGSLFSLYCFMYKYSRGGR